MIFETTMLKSRRLEILFPYIYQIKTPRLCSPLSPATDYWPGFHFSANRYVRPV